MTTRHWIYLAAAALAAALGYWWWSSRNKAPTIAPYPLGQSLINNTPPPVQSSSGAKGLTQALGAGAGAAACAGAGGVGAIASPLCGYLGGQVAGQAYDYGATGVSKVTNLVSSLKFW